MNAVQAAAPPSDSLPDRIGAAGRRWAARWLVSRRVGLDVDGLDHVPLTGPVILVARHYHHLYDAAILLATLPREPHLVVALDWVPSGLPFRLMRWLSRAARWPGVWRPSEPTRPITLGVQREGLATARRLLREGRVLVIFPEGYPTVDPAGSRKAGEDQFLPFAAGFVSLALAVGRDLGAPVPLVPVGFHYTRRPGDRWFVHMRVGEPLLFPGRPDRSEVVAALEAEVRALSTPPR